VTQRAVKLAIKQAISADIDRQKEREAAGEDITIRDRHRRSRGSCWQ
jgi:transitional endoplasmic reticulum ATPase